MITRSDLFTQEELHQLVKAGLMHAIEPGIFAWTATGHTFVGLLVGLLSGKLETEYLSGDDA